MRILLTSLLLVSLAVSCSPEGETKAKLNRSFRAYIKNNDAEKDLITNLKDVEVISFTELTVERDKHKALNEKYEALIYMRGTTSYAQGSRIYNLDDTVSCYFDESYKMLRLQHLTE